MSREITRRDALKAGAATAGLTALSGCNAIEDAIPFIGGVNYTDWAFEPGTVTDADHLTISYLDYGTVVENESEFDSDYYEESFESNEDSFPLSAVNLDVEDVSVRVGVSGYGGMFEADYNQDDVASHLGDEDYDEDTTHEGYTIYLGSDENQAVGIDGNRIVHGSSGFLTDANPVDIVETLIDTAKGDENRYVDDSQPFADLSDELGTTTILLASTQDAPDETDAENGQFEGNVASGFSSSVDGQTTAVKVVFVFENESDVDMGDIETYADTDSFDNLNDVSTNRNGNRAIISGTVDTDELGETMN
ncbi:hypothetical protein BV210_13600 [Halorientalis sp. IM1011]|uniref:twin-arginine translocation signal domain-containing protein n=1 Tax=Halorientalis sp. IM1011 TaxID=1932360 RepID=UPI00097CCF12|nr:twin-arginine translocation signal domain-containing protein [Halorientalis sp. IM1011]AQL43672.1 hypothetical protein BV210_13600 [Halorientalis sp. IM1011]